MKHKMPIALAAIAILGTTLAYGQNASRVLVRVSVPYKFVVGKQMLPAGTYEIMKGPGSSEGLALRNAKTGKTINLTVIEHLARIGNETHEGRFVFDRVGDQRFLSEFWPSGRGDGYLLQVNKKEHGHEIVK